jgi:hypothetical protein
MKNKSGLNSERQNIKYDLSFKIQFATDTKSTEKENLNIKQGKEFHSP